MIRTKGAQTLLSWLKVPPFQPHLIISSSEGGVGCGDYRWADDASLSSKYSIIYIIVAGAPGAVLRNAIGVLWDYVADKRGRLDTKRSIPALQARQDLRRY